VGLTHQAVSKILALGNETNSSQSCQASAALDPPADDYEADGEPAVLTIIDTDNKRNGSESCQAFATVRETNSSQTGQASAELLDRTDADGLRRLAAAIIENALAYATSTAAGVSPHDKADAIAFLVDDADPRLSWWCAALDLDPDALRDGVRARLRRLDREREDAA
jgi:hypothetical protein